VPIALPYRRLILLYSRPMTSARLVHRERRRPCKVQAGQARHRDIMLQRTAISTASLRKYPIGSALGCFAAHALRVTSLLQAPRAAMIAPDLTKAIPVKVVRNPPIQEPTGARDCALKLINSQR
jgi:hypothetical protein